jgi:hypothetical protein
MRKFIDATTKNDFIQVEKLKTDTDLFDVINITGICNDEDFCIWLNKSNAIKFAKTLRTEINKITESEVNNG